MIRSAIEWLFKIIGALFPYALPLAGCILVSVAAYMAYPPLGVFLLGCACFLMEYVFYTRKDGQG